MTYIDAGDPSGAERFSKFFHGIVAAKVADRILARDGLSDITSFVQADADRRLAAMDAFDLTQITRGRPSASSASTRPGLGA